MLFLRLDFQLFLLRSCYLITVASRWLGRTRLDTVHFPSSRENRFCSSLHSLKFRKLPCILKIDALAFLNDEESLQNSKSASSKEGLCWKLCER